MEIPEAVNVGRSTYRVLRVNKLERGRLGQCDTESKTIEVCQRDRYGAPLEQSEIAQVFLHELTHAILKDMRHPLWDNESFVERFSKRLHQALG